MRRASFRWWCFGTLALGLLGGCQDLGLPTGLSDSTPGSKVTPASGSPSDLAEADSDGDLAAQAQAHAQRVAGTGELPEQAQPIREILWRDVGGSQAANIRADAVSPSADKLQAQPTGVPVTHGQVLLSGAGQDPASRAGASTSSLKDPVASSRPRQAAGDPGRLTQTRAYSQLLQAVRRGDDSNLSKAVTAATLAAIGPYGELDWTLLAPLSPTDQQRVQIYYRAVAAMRSELLAGAAAVNREAVADRLEEVFGSQPVSIRTIELCEKVMGYGVYDSFPDLTFVAGREQKVIVYVELENFKPAQREGADGYEVRLRQELELYESNGFEVWSHEPVVITDVSHNKRRDFFVVQLVTLPAQLRMGQYHLKVRVYDENAGTRDEGSVTIKLVADDALVKQGGR